MRDPVFGEVIYSYSRKQAIDDGVLVDLSAVAPDVCKMFKYPIACTRSIWEIVDRAVKNKKHGNDLNGVIHDILWMAKNGKIDGDRSYFKVTIKGSGRQSLFDFYMVCGPGDSADPVLTIMQLGED